MGGFYGGTEP